MKTATMYQRMSAAMKNMTRAFLAIAAMLVAGPLLAADLAVEKVEFAALPGNQMEIRLDFNGVPPEPTGYAIQQPARIALDVVGAKSVLESKHHNLGTGNARSMTVVEARDRTRVIINLNELVGYSTRVEGNSLVVRIGDDRQQAEAVVVAGANAPASGEPAGQASGLRGSVAGRGIVGIDFRRRPDGEGQVVVSLSQPSIPVDVRQEGGRILVEFVGASLPQNLRKKLDVTDFATPVTSIVSSVSGENVVMSIEPRGQYDYLAYQADKELIIGVKPVTTAEQQRRKADTFMYTGEKLSLNFQDIEVRSVLQLIADFTSLNLVASDTVSGRITLRLQNVPWDQALDLVLKTKRLDKRQIGNVLLVAPADEIAAREKQEMEAYNQSEALAPLRSEFAQVNYAKAADLAKVLRADKSLMSSRGSLTIDDRTNTLIIVETAKRLEDIRDIIRRLDVPVGQVLIEARIVLASSDLAKELGVRWGGVDIAGLGQNKSTLVTGSLNQATTAGVGVLNSSTIPVAIPDSLAVDMGVTSGGASRFSLGLIKMDSGLLQMELSALTSDGHGELVATPKVLTSDQQEAVIASGTQIPYQEASSSGATSTSFRDAELKLQVRPQITPDGKVIMTLSVNNDSVGDLTPDNIPTINTNRIETVVLVSDGDTVVLGGIFTTNTISATIKTPFFGDLPVVGRFFRKDVRSDRKQELLIFVTPKIVKDMTAQG